MTLLICLAALLLDALLGEPRRWHPLVGFGRCASRIEGALYGSGTHRAWEMRLRGGLAVLLVVAPPVLLLLWLVNRLPHAWVVELGVLYLCIGRQSLRQHIDAIGQPLARGDLDLARRQTARIVSRDTAQLDRDGVARAAVESTLENGHDALFASLFWFAVGGAPAALLHRLVNTLDAMWGYRNARYHAFGWAAARGDDLLGWIPARLTAVGYLLAGRASAGWRCWRLQAPLHDSPNAGPVMAAGAGALEIEVGGDTRYKGHIRSRPRFGCGRPVEAGDIARALRLLDRSLLLWLLALAVLSLLSLLRSGCA